MKRLAKIADPFTPSSSLFLLPSRLSLVPMRRMGTLLRLRCSPFMVK